MANLKDAVQFALCVAMGIVYILKPLLDFLDGVQPLSPVLEAAVALLTISLLPLFIPHIHHRHATPRGPGACRAGGPRCGNEVRLLRLHHGVGLSCCACPGPRRLDVPRRRRAAVGCSAQTDGCVVLDFR